MTNGLLTRSIHKSIDDTHAQIQTYIQTYQRTDGYRYTQR